MILLGGATLLIALAGLRRFDRLARAESAAALMLAFFMLPTQIHERYMFSGAGVSGAVHRRRRALCPTYGILALNATLNIIGDLSEFVPIAHTYIAGSPRSRSRWRSPMRWCCWGCWHTCLCARTNRARQRHALAAEDSTHRWARRAQVSADERR